MDWRLLGSPNGIHPQQRTAESPPLHLPDPNVAAAYLVGAETTMMVLHYAALGLLLPLSILQVFHFYTGNYALGAVDTILMIVLVVCILLIDRQNDAE